MADKNAFLIRLLATVIILAVFVFLFVKDLDAETKKKIRAGCYYTGEEPILVCPSTP